MKGPLQNSPKEQKRSFYSFRVEVALLRYIVFYFKSGCDASEPHVSTISRACSSLVRQSYYAPNCIISKIRGLETILASEKGRLDGRTFYIDEYTLIFLFLQCMRCAQKRYCWESVRFASERSRIRTATATTAACPLPFYCSTLLSRMRSLSRVLPAFSRNFSSRSSTVILLRFSPFTSNTMRPLSIIRVRLPSSNA